MGEKKGSSSSGPRTPHHTALRAGAAFTEGNNPTAAWSPTTKTTKRAPLCSSVGTRSSEQHQQVVSAEPLTVVSGVSGSGKSSLVRVGLIRRPRQSPDWFVPPWWCARHRPLSAPGIALRRSARRPIQTSLPRVTAWREHKLKSCPVHRPARGVGDQGRRVRRSTEVLGSVQSAWNTPVPRRRRDDAASDFEPHFSERLLPKPGTQVRFFVRPLSRPSCVR